MASVATTFPRPPVKRPRSNPAAGRANFPEIYFVKHIDNSRLRREVDREKSRDCLCVLGLGILVFIFGLLFALQHFHCLRLGYQIEQLKAQKATLEEWNHQLRVEQASLADPQRIDVLARNRLGLAPPRPQQVIVLGKGVRAAEAAPPEFARNFASADNSREP